MIYDSHVHCYELEGQLSSFVGKYVIACVAEDISSSEKVLRYSSEFENIVPCVGVHPWNISSAGFSSIKQFFSDLLKREEVKCLGEVGLDKRFVPHTFDAQLEAFKFFVELAREYGLALNLHAANAWREVYEIVNRHDIEGAVFHWYTGPHDLLEEITGSGYYIGINPAWKIQRKHLAIAERAPLDKVLTESDAPYKYRELELSPAMIEETIELLAKIHKVSRAEVELGIERNFRELFAY